MTDSQRHHSNRFNVKPRKLKRLDPERVNADPVNRSNRFFIAGGTLPPDAASYVVREADHELLDGLRAGEFCYVLNTRQMGKSSLMVRAATRLAAEGIATLVLDLTANGQNVTVEQWFDGLLNQMGRELNLEDELDDYRLAHPELGPLARWMGALKDVVLLRLIGPLVVFVDEIDVVKSLPFSTDEFFAGIRQCYNQGALHPDLNRLTFCLLGVATPASLVRDVRISPFNIGRRIDLRDFTAMEATPLIAGLGSETLLSRVLYWTGGHPYLTQRLCQAVMDATEGESAPRSIETVDRVCKSIFLTQSAQERDANLLFVRDRILAEHAELTAIMELYVRILSGAEASATDLRLAAGVLQLAGLVRSEQGFLRVRNRIYAQVFNRAWARDRMPDAELRRQRAAYRRGLARASAVAALIIGALAGLTLLAATNEQRSRLLARNLKEALAVKAAAVSKRDEAIRSLQAARRRADSATHLALIRAGQARAAEQTAQRRQREADAQRHEALARTRESQQRAEQLLLTAGTRAADEGDPNGALLWYDRAADLDLPSHSRYSPDRLRIATTLRHLPRLVGMWFDARSACFRPGGKQILVAHRDGSAHIYDTQTGTPLSPAMRHEKGLAGARFSADTHRVLTYGDHTVRVWDAVTGAPVTPPLRSLSPVQDACFSPDGSLVAAGALSGEAHVWSATTGHERHVTNGCPDINHIEFSPDGRTVALSTGYYGAIWRFAADAHEHEALVPIVHGAGRYTLTFNPDGTHLATTCDDGTAQVWDTATGKPLMPPMRHVGPIHRAHFSPDGTRIVTASADHTACIWDAATGSAATPLLRHSGEVNDAVFSPDGSKIVTLGSDSTARLWDAITGQSLAPPLWHSGGVLTAEFDAEGRRLLTLDKSGVVRLWDLAAAGLPDGFAGEYANTACAAFSPDGHLLATGDFDCGARLWNAATGQAAGPLLTHGGPVRTLAFSPNSRILATGSDDRNIRLWDVRSGRMIASLGHFTGMNQLAFDALGRRIAAVSNTSATFWDVSTGRQLCRYSSDGKSLIISAAFRPRVNQALVATADGIIRLYDLPTGKLLRKLRQAGPLMSATFSPDGATLLITGPDGTTRMWNVGTAKPVLRPMWDQTAILSVAFRPDGRQFVTASASGEARLWNAAGASVGPPLRHRDAVSYAAFSHNGRYVITCSADHTARIWDAATGAPLTPPLPHASAVRHALFSPDDRQAVTICDDGIARLWTITEKLRHSDSLRARLELLAARRVDTAGGLLTLDLAGMRARWQVVRAQREADAPPPAVLHSWYLAEAYSAIEGQRWSLALPHLDRLLERYPEDRQARAWRASIYARQGRWRDVEVDLGRLYHGQPCLVVLAAHRPVQETTLGQYAMVSGDIAHVQALSCWSDSSVLVLLPAPARHFSTTVGVGKNPPWDVPDVVSFSVMVAQRKVAAAPERQVLQPGLSLSVPLGGATAFLLETRHKGQDLLAAWADPQVELMDGRTIRLNELSIWPVGGL